MNLHQQPPVSLQSEYVYLDSKRITTILFAIAAMLSVVGAFANIVIYQIAESPDANIARFMSRFDLGHEPSLPAWFSSLVLLLDSAMLVLISRVVKLRGKPYFAHWLILGIIFLGLSIDESVMFHEMLNEGINLIISTKDIFLFPWVVVGLLFVVTVFLAYLKFLFHLPRRFALLFVLSGAIFVGGAVGMEIIAGIVIGQYGVASIYHTIVQTIEESLEMAGAILFFYSLTQFWASNFGSIRFKLRF